MAKKKAAETTAETAPASPAEKMTQREAVEKALAAGMDTPAEGVPYVKGQFGIVLDNQAFSSIKSKIKSGSGAAAKQPGRPDASANGAVAHKPAAKTPPAVTNPAELARAVKELVTAHGAETIKDMVDVFAK